MDDPAQQDEPKSCSQTELDDSDCEPTLEQLSKSRNEEAREGREHISTRALTCHRIPPLRRITELSNTTGDSPPNV